jgi:peptidoglycan/LPS O-acetylase OafA/YrhL
MWSVATEWQIYFIFPALLLPLWRGTGAAGAVVAAWVIGSLPFFLLPPDENFYWACPWFLGSFALGMASAATWFAPAPFASAMPRRLPWAPLAMASFVALVALVVTGRVDTWPRPLVDLVVSVFAFCLINACAQRASAGAEKTGPLLRVLGSRALVFVAGFSYSLYLLQHPVLRFSERVLAALHLSSDAIVAAHLLVVTPLVMVLAWIFSELFEKPFLASARKPSGQYADLPPKTAAD